MIVNYTRALVISALLAGLAFVANFLLLLLPNVSLAFFIVFLAGYVLGYGWGMLTGGLAWFLISFYNPYGMAMLPLLIVQILCGALIGLCWAFARKLYAVKVKNWQTYIIYALWGGFVSAVFMGGVSVADAFLFGPFKERLLLGLGFSMLTVLTNIFIFPILSPLVKYVKEIVVMR